MSVVLPTRNAAWCLPYALRSITSQSQSPDEILICVGKSKDMTEEIVLKFQKESKIPVHIYYDREGRGTAYAMNLLTNNAIGDVILWADSDGVRSYWWIETTLEYFILNPDLVYLCTHQHETDSHMISTFVQDNKRNEPSITYDNQRLENPSGLVAFKKEYTLKVGGFDEFFVRGQDRDLVIRMLEFGALGGEENNLQGYHFGVQGSRNFMKAFSTPTFFKFIYKYGWKYCLIDLHHFAGAVLRTFFLFSLIWLITSLLTGTSIVLPTASIVTSMFALAEGIKISHKVFNFNLLFLQILGSFGEYYQLYRIFKIKERPKMGYGKIWLK